MNGLFREEGDMGGDDDIGKGEKTGEEVVIDEGLREVFVEKSLLFFVDVERCSADLFRLKPLN